MSKDAHTVGDCQCRAWVRRALVACVIAVVVLVLVLLYAQLSTELSGQKLRRVFVVILASITPAYILSVTIGCASKRSGWANFLAETVLLAVLFLVFLFVFTILSGQTQATFYGDEHSGVLSAYETFFVWTICAVGISAQLLLVASDRFYHQASLITGGSLVMIGIFMPKFLESYELLRASCHAFTCDADLLLLITQYEVAFAFVASMAALSVAGIFMPTWRPWLFGLFDGTTPCLICGRNARRNIGQSVTVGLYEDSAGGLGDATSALGSEERTARAESMQRAVGAMRGDALSRQWMGAAVSGVVAGVCFSVVSRLFSRR